MGLMNFLKGKKKEEVHPSDNPNTVKNTMADLHSAPVPDAPHLDSDSMPPSIQKMSSKPDVPQHVDDLDIPPPSASDQDHKDSYGPMEAPILEAPSMPEKPDMDLPPPPPVKLEQESIEVPPAEKQEEADVPNAVESESSSPAASMPSVKKGVSEEIPNEIPELEAELNIPSPSQIAQPSMEVKQDTVSPQEAMPTSAKGEGPIFVGSSRFAEIKINISDIRASTKRSESLSSDLNDLKQKEDAGFNNWHSSLEEIERKISYIDRALFESE